MSATDVKKHGNADDAKTVTIIVNGRAKAWAKNEDITFEQVVALAFPNPPSGDGIQFTVQSLPSSTR
jgi:hypothetical protein